ncbi:MAG: sulfotransferase [Pseudomonadota bacterium]|nr:sulfotransferase [Pseudomonadota bacterium]
MRGLAQGRRVLSNRVIGATQPDGPILRFQSINSGKEPKITAAGISTRVFLVGCPRSGTTLLQSMLYAHPEIYSFPETHFFKVLFGVGEQLTLRRRPQGLGRKLRVLALDKMGLLGILDGWSRARAWEIIRTLPDFDAAALSNSISLRHHAEAFVQIVDAASLKAGRRMWLEKTPDHLFCVRRIQQYIPDAIFIHLIRNGPDTIASLIDAGSKYPDVWGKESPSLIEASVRRWNIALLESLQYRGNPRHYLVRYEELVSDPVQILSGLCGFLGCDFDKKMVEGHSEKVSDLIRGTEPWKTADVGPLRNTADTKFRKIFSSAWQDYILRHIERW